MAKKQRVELFLAKVVMEPGGCWRWIGAKGGVSRGIRYGVFYNGTKLVQAHRWSYEFFIGPIPDDEGLDHFHCERPDCVNPWHVRPASQRENVLRGDTFQARNLAKEHCPHGHPYDDVNTMHKRRGKATVRICRTCELEYQRRQRARKAVEAGREPGRLGRPRVREPKVPRGRAVGERHGMSKLTQAQVAEIRRRRAAGERQLDLAAEYGVSRMTVHRITSGQAWKEEG